MKTELKEILPIITQHHKGEDRQLVDARTLWQFLGSKQEFANWIKVRIDEYEFKENQDYFLIILSNKKSQKDGRGRKPIDYLITLSMAKELAMVEKNKQGKLARQYFIRCEETLQAIAPDLLNEIRQHWHKEREAVKTPFTRLCQALERQRSRQGKSTEKHHYTNEANMLLSLVVGMNITHWKKAHKVQGDVRNALNAEQLERLEYLETADRFLLDMNITSFYQRKNQLVEMLKGLQ